MSASEENLNITIAEPIGFAAEQLVACTNCAKTNAPTKLNCLYCGHALPATEANAESGFLSLRRLEAWEPGINLVVDPVAIRSIEELDKVSQILAIDSAEIDEIVNSGFPLPLARVEDEQTADTAAKTLSDVGVTTRTFADKLLDAEHPPIRVRAMQVGNTGMILADFNAAKSHTLSIDDVVLIVTGRISESRREEVTRRKRGAVKVLDEFETSGDVGVVDIYSKTDAVGFRIQTNGFDFSVLGDDKELLAGKNLSKLVELLKTICVNAALATEYNDVRHHLDLVWEPDFKKDSHGLQMRGYGKREFGATYISSNQTQFTKYSRLRRMMI